MQQDPGTESEEAIQIKEEPEDMFPLNQETVHCEEKQLDQWQN